MEGWQHGGMPPDWSLLERPMGPRSIIASVLLGMHPPRQTSARLVRWCGFFGISENATRVALSRMVDRGELRMTDVGYELAGAVRERQRGQDRSIAPDLGPWTGHWLLAVVSGERRPPADRAAFRATMRRHRFAELREGVWGRPDNLGPDAAAALPGGPVLWRAVALDREPTTTEVAEWFGLDAWIERADHLVARVRASIRAIDSTFEPGCAVAPNGLAAVTDGFVVGAAALQHLGRDPLLPGALLPRDWPGDALRIEYARFQARFARAAAQVLRD